MRIWAFLCAEDVI